MKKYVKPHSLTWWASLVPLVAGLFVAAQDLHGMALWVEFVNSATDGMSPAVLINMGLLGIGFRGAMGS